MKAVTRGDDGSQGKLPTTSTEKAFSQFTNFGAQNIHCKDYSKSCISTLWTLILRTFYHQHCGADESLIVIIKGFPNITDYYGLGWLTITTYIF